MNSSVRIRNHLQKFPYIPSKIGLPRDIPRDKHDFFESYKICDGKYTAELINPSNRQEVKKVMLDNFYCKAPVPVALGLHKNKEGKTIISDFLEDEISLFLDTGVSFAIFHGHKIIGVGTNLIFNRLANKT